MAGTPPRTFSFDSQGPAMSARRSTAAVCRQPRPINLTRPPAPRRVARIVVAEVACILQAFFGVTVSVSGLIMPMGAVLLLGPFWVAGVIVMFFARRRPALMIAVPMVSWVVWFAVAWIGDAWWGWTA